MPPQYQNDDDRRVLRLLHFIISGMFKVSVYIKFQKTKEECFDLWENHCKSKKKPQKGYVGNFFQLKISKQIREKEKWKQRTRG